MQLSFKTKLLGGFGLLFVMFILIGWKLNLALETSNQSVTGMTHSKEVIESLKNVRAAIYDIETGMQGFVITSGKEYLDRFLSGLARIDTLKKSLRTVVSDNLQQNTNLDTLDDLIKTEIDISDAIVQKARVRGSEGSLSTLFSPADKKNRLQLRSQIELMEDFEKKKYLNRLQLIEDNDSGIRLLIFSCFILGLSASILLFISLRRFNTYQHNSRIEFEHQLKEQTEKFISTNHELMNEIEAIKNIHNSTIKSEAKFRHLLDSMIESCQIIGFDWKYLYLNDSAFKLTGKTNDELLGKTMMDIYPGIEHTGMFAKLKQCMEERTPQFLENKFTFPDGREGYFDLKIQPISEGIFVLAVDISERKNAKKALQKSEATLNEAGKLANVGGWEIEVPTMSLHFSLQTYHIHELNPTDKIDVAQAIRYYSPEAQPIITDAFNRCLNSGEIWNLELPLITAKGNHIWVHTQGQAEFKDGKCIRVFGAIQNITERKKAEENIKKSEEQFRLISENVADMICVLDLDGKRIYNSPSYKSILGYSQSLVGTDSFQEIHPDDREKIRSIFYETVKTGNSYRVEYRLMLQDESIRFVESQGTVIKDTIGKVVRVVVVSRDITEKKQLENQFLRMQRMESIGTLAGGIAHDLNNILSPILLSVSVLSKKLTDPQSMRMLHILESSTKRGSELIKQVLSFARGVEGEFTLIQVRHIIDEIGKIINQTFPKSIELHTNLHKNLPAISADATQIHQVLMNLCVNARDAMPNGGKITIEAESIALDEQYIRMHLEAKLGTYVVITVTDQGSGIPPATLERIFEPFFTTKSIDKGTGLGLSTVLTIIKSHNGFVNVYSEVGNGTTFKIYLPAQENAVIDVVSEKEKNLLGDGELILVVDDEESIREITKVTLEANGYSAITAVDGTEAITAFATHGNKIALVITDMMMPYMDGTATIRALQKMNPDVKIIAVSGLKQDGQIIHQDNVTFLNKPYTSEKLIFLIGERLQEKVI